MRLASGGDFRYEFLVHHDQEDRFFSIPDRSTNPPLLVLPIGDRDETTGVVELLRHSPHPTLITGPDPVSGR